MLLLHALLLVLVLLLALQLPVLAVARCYLTTQTMHIQETNNGPTSS